MKQTRQPVSIGRKQEVFHWIETVGEGKPTRAVAHFRAAGWSVDGGAVRRWWRLREKIKAAAPHQARVAGDGRKPLSETLEELPYEDEAAELQSPPPFAASDHWVSNFMHRFEISLCRRTNLTVLDDDVLVNRAVCYMSFLREQVPTINLEKTVLMDETAVYFEDARASTLDITGARYVVVRSTGFASMRITVVIAVSATGRKLLVW
ncbi:hypothetical protein C6341_g1142 [Phytophthora cactorum]|nr:hypothetical protein C6341_g1142 [Phytophthora cactorum]